MIKHLETTSIVNWQYYFYRTKHGAEVDLILDGHFGLIPIEIKLGQTVTQKQLVTLKAFISENKSPLGILINQADTIEMLADNIIQIPAHYLV